MAVLSHELRMPLTPVMMGVSMLQDRPDLAPEVREILEMVLRNVEMEAHLIDDLLDVTRMRGERLTCKNSVCNSASSFTAVWRSASPTLRPAGCISA